MGLGCVTCLKYPNKEAVCHEFRVALRAVLQEGKNAPASLKSGNGIVHWKQWKYDSKWQLANNSPCDVHGIEVH